MLTEAAGTVLVVSVLALFAVVGYQMLSGVIKMHGVLSDKATGELSPGRVQLLLATIGGGGFYLFAILGASGTGAMPPVPEVLLWATGASNAGYLVGKIQSSFWPSWNPFDVGNVRR